MEHKPLLVTGGCGFIGTNFIRHSLNRFPERKIFNLDLLTYAGMRENLEEFEGCAQYEFIHGDVCDEKLAREILEEVDCVVHFAAESHVDRSIDGAREFARTNELGTVTLLEAARQAWPPGFNGKRFHHVSTDEVYGELGAAGRFTEESPYLPNSAYSASKAGADHHVRAAFRTHGLPVTISNCSNNYGPYQHPEKFIPVCITKLLNDESIPIYGEGKNVRDWIHVEDHVRAIETILMKGVPGETYLVGADCDIPNNQVVDLLLAGMQKPQHLKQYVRDRQGHDFRYAIDAGKLRRSLGWIPRYEGLDGFRAGLAHTIDWYESHREWTGKVLERTLRLDTERKCS